MNSIGFITVSSSAKSEFGERLEQDKLIDMAIKKANIKAQNIAKSIGVTLLYTQYLHKEIITSQGNNQSPSAWREVEAKVTIKYQFKGFNQRKIDLRIIKKSGNIFHIVKNELSKLFYKIRTLIFIREPDNVTHFGELSCQERAIITGHFSFPGGGGTFGDIEALEKVCEWLSDVGIDYEIASNHEDGVEGISLDKINEKNYGFFIFVCGPWYHDKDHTAMLLERFHHCIKIGVNLTIFEDGMLGFDHLLSRDDLENSRVDIAFAKKVDFVPVVGVILTLRQTIYGNKQRHLYVKQIIEEYLSANNVVPIWLDTVINQNKAGLKNSAQFESIIRKVDLVITNRLHGLVLGLKNLVPIIAIDAVAGGGKVTAQAKALGWPILIPAEDLDVDKLKGLVEHCFSTSLDDEIKNSHDRAVVSIDRTKKQFVDIF